MLSFLRDQEPEFEDSPTEKPPADADKISDQTDQQAPEQEYITVATKDKSVRKTTYILAVLFGIGLLCLLFMISKSTPQTATAAAVSTEETQIEMAIARLTGVSSKILNRMDEVVKKFYEFSDVQQVKVSQLTKNPFKHDILSADLEVGNAEKPDIDLGMMWQGDLKRQADRLQLLSIMQSDQGSCCMIDEEILYKGDLIRGFRVREINGNSVTLEWDTKRHGEDLPVRSETMEIVLKLSE